MRHANRVLIVVVMCAALVASPVAYRTAASGATIAPTSSTGAQEEAKTVPSETQAVLVAFRTPRTGFAVESLQRLVSGNLDAGDFDARILRTENGGRTWKLVWQHDGAELTSVTTVGGRILASGHLMSASGAFSTPFLVSSVDDGQRWTVQHPKVQAPDTGTLGSFGGRLVFLDVAIGFMLPAPEDISPPWSPPLRTTNGGRTWKAFLVGGQQPDAIAFVTNSHWIVTTEGNKRCAGQMWSTTNAGTSWSAIPGTCERFLLTSVSFPTATTGYAAGGYPQDDPLFPERAVLTTRDAGRTWRVTWERGGPGTPGAGAPFYSITFATADLGYVLLGACTIGQNGPCGAPLWRTTNGGATWTYTGFGGYELDPVGPHELWLTSGPTPDARPEIPEVSTDAASTFTPRPLPAVVSFSS